MQGCIYWKINPPPPRAFQSMSFWRKKYEKGEEDNVKGKGEKTKDKEEIEVLKG